MRAEFQEAFATLGWALGDFISLIEKMPTAMLEELRKEFDEPDDLVPERHKFMFEAGRKCVDYELNSR